MKKTYLNAKLAFMTRLPRKRGITQVEEDKSLILRQKMDLNKCLTKVSDLAKYKEVGLSTTFAVVTGCIRIRKWQI